MSKPLLTTTPVPWPTSAHTSTKHGGSLGTQGSLTFLFDHKSVFKIKPKDGVSLEDLELELIDYGVDELEDITDDESGEEQVILYGAFEEYSNIQKYLEDNGFEIISSEFERIPNDLKEVTAEQRAAIEKLLERSKRTRMCRTCSTT